LTTDRDNGRLLHITLDGPAGSGKSTIAKALANRLGISYYDTGAAYRAVAYCCLKRGVDLQDEEAVINQLDDLDINVVPDGSGQRIFVMGEDVTDKIRTRKIAEGASVVSTYGMVREFLVNMQRIYAARNSVVMDGRDIGTVVLPNAEYKFFITASAKERAKRRWMEMKEAGSNAEYEEVLAEMRRRDERDATRKISPLQRAKDAVLVDNTEMSAEESLKFILSHIAGGTK